MSMINYLSRKVPRPLLTIFLAVGVSLALVVTSLTAGGAVIAALSPNPCANGYVVLTFDDGPSPKTTSKIVEIFKKYKAVAVFFNVGKSTAEFPQLIELQAREGHQFGNHTYDHYDLLTLPESELMTQMLGATDAHMYLTGDNLRFFRPPEGKTHPNIVRMAQRLGMTQVLWDIDPRDFDPGRSPEQIARVTLTAGDGEIVLLHENVDATVEALPEILEGFKSKKMCTGKFALDDHGNVSVVPAND